MTVLDHRTPMVRSPHHNSGQWLEILSVVVLRPTNSTSRVCFEVKVSESLVDYYPCGDKYGEYEFSYK